MALIDCNTNGPVFDPAPDAPFATDPGYRTAPYAALAALPRLQAEAGTTLQLGRFLAQSSFACMILMLTGVATLAATGLAGGGTLKTDFTWAVLVLLGVIAMIRNHIRGFARSLRRVPLQEAAADLRVLLLYTGAAWASGAFLLMPGNPAPALVFSFAALPSLALALTLKDRAGVMAFTAPVTVAAAGAAILGAWPMDVWVAGATVAFGFGVFCLPALQRS
jgi:hypothetical protein